MTVDPADGAVSPYSTYLPLDSLFTVDVATLVQQAVADAQAGKWPDWVPREGQHEVVLLELLAGVAAADGEQVNAWPQAVAEGLLRMTGLSRSVGSPASVGVRFAVALSPTAVTIPVGVQVAVLAGGGVEVIPFTTTTAVTIPAGQTTGVVTARSVDSTNIYNGYEAGLPVQVLTAVQFVDSAVTTTQITSGVQPEDQPAFLDRAIVRFSRLNETLVTVGHFTAAALEREGVARAFTVDQYNPDTPGTAPGGAAGHVTVAVLGQNGSVLTPSDREALRVVLQGGAYVMITVHVVDPTITTVNVATTVVASAGMSSADVQTSVQSALSGYLSPDEWGWGATIYLNELISLIDGAAGVERVVSATINGAAADFTLSGVAPLVDLGAATVTVA